MTTDGPRVVNRENAPAYWLQDSLWLVLAGAEDTDGNFAVMEQWIRATAGPAPHVHSCDEWIYVIDGILEIRADDERITARPGDSLWLPRGTTHSFRVLDEARILNGYTPGGIEQVFAGTGEPAPERTLPPADFPQPTHEQTSRMMTNYWTAYADSPWARDMPPR